MANNGNGMHFVYYSHKIADNGAEEYLHRKQKKIEQTKKGAEYDLLSQYDSPIDVYVDAKDAIKYINFDNGDYTDCSLYYYPVHKSNGKMKNLCLWVGYDIGGEEDTTGEIIERGYWLYFTVDFARKKACRKILLVCSKKKNKKQFQEAIQIAKYSSKEIVENYYPTYSIEWNKPVLEKYADKSLYMENNLVNLRKFRTISNCNLIY